jgi:hypothetical protein
MGKRKPGLTLEEHKAIGAELKAMSERLAKLSVQVTTAYSVSSRHGGYSISGIHKAAKGVDSARCWLEECLFDDCPADADTSIYYGGP